MRIKLDENLLAVLVADLVALDTWSRWLVCGIERARDGGVLDEESDGE